MTNKKKLNNFAKNIVKIRTELGLSRTDLHIMLDIDYKRLQAWELGQNEPSMDFLILIAKELKVTVDRLIK